MGLLLADLHDIRKLHKANKSPPEEAAEEAEDAAIPRTFSQSTIRPGMSAGIAWTRAGIERTEIRRPCIRHALDILRRRRGLRQRRLAYPWRSSG